MAFKAINTQEELDAVIKDRLERADAKVRKEFEGYMSPKDVEALKKTYEEKEGDTKKYEKYMSPEDVEALKKTYTSQIDALKLDQVRIKVAQKNKLPMEFANRLKGSNEEELQKDAEAIASFMPKDPWPGKQTEPPVGGDESEVKGLLSQFRED